MGSLFIFIKKDKKNRKSKEVGEHGAVLEIDRLSCGTRDKYDAGCRCDMCRLVVLRWLSDKRARNRANLPFKEINHGLSGYTNHGCRCDICRKAKSDKQKIWRARQRATNEALDT